MVCVNSNEEDTTIMVVSEKGYGKRTDIDDYRITGRGGKGVKTLSITEKTGALISMKDVTDENDLMIITKLGITIRMKMEDVRVMGRATQGVRLIKVRDKDAIASVAKVPRADEEDEELEETEFEDIDNSDTDSTETKEENDTKTEENED
jgi:DNA gyrase subunit A